MKKSFQKCILQTRKKLMNHTWDEMFLQYFAISAKISQQSISKEFSNILIFIYLHYEVQNSQPKSIRIKYQARRRLPAFLLVQNNCNAGFQSMCRAPKKFFMSVMHNFLKNSCFFKIEKFQFLRKMEDFCHFDALNFLKVKSGEKNKNVSKQ